MMDGSVIRSDDVSSTQEAKERAADATATAKDGATQVAGTTKEGVQDVAKETLDQARAVTGMAKEHAQGLVDQTTSQLRTHGDEQAQRAAGGLDQIARQVGSLLDGRPEDAGPVRDYAEQLGDKAQQLAEQLRSGGIDGVVSDVSSFARRRPGLFLAGAAAAGFMAGRLVKAQRAASDGSNGTGADNTSSGNRYQSALPAEVRTLPVSDVPGTADIPPLPVAGTAPDGYGNPAPAGPLGAAPGGGTW